MVQKPQRKYDLNFRNAPSFFLTAILLSCLWSPAQTTLKAKIIVLGVTHSAQLVNPNFQPAVFRAFISNCKPRAICIERSPEEFIRNSFYEFTYEQQYCIIPFAKENNISVFPFDWEPPSDDIL